MIQIPAALAVARVAAGYWKPIAVVLLVVAVLLLAYGVGRGHANRAWEAKHNKAMANWAAETARAAEVSRAAEAEARRIETAWRDHVSQREKEYKDAVHVRDARIAELSVAGGRLRSAVDNFVRASSTSSDPSAACGDLRNRVTTLGALLQEADGLAGESAAAADRTRDSLSLCRGYAQAVSH